MTGPAHDPGLRGDGGPRGTDLKFQNVFICELYKDLFLTLTVIWILNEERMDEARNPIVPSREPVARTDRYHNPTYFCGEV